MKNNSLNITLLSIVLLSFSINWSYSQKKDSYFYTNEISFGVGYANGFEKHVFNIQYDEAVNSAIGVNLNYCYFINNEIGIGARILGYYKELPEYVLIDPNGKQENVKYDLTNFTINAEFRYVFSRGQIMPYGFLTAGMSGGNVSHENDDLNFYGFNAGIGAGVEIPIGFNWRLSAELFGTVGTAGWEEKPFLNSRSDDFNPSMAGALLNISYVFGKKEKMKLNFN